MRATGADIETGDAEVEVNTTKYARNNMGGGFPNSAALFFRSFLQLSGLLAALRHTLPGSHPGDVNSTETEVQESSFVLKIGPISDLGVHSVQLSLSRVMAFGFSLFKKPC